MTNPKHGVRKSTAFIDDNGSTETVELRFYSGVVSKPIRHYFEINHKVSGAKEEHEAYIAFSDSLVSDKTILDPAWRWEYPKALKDTGYYLAIGCYTKLEY